MTPESQPLDAGSWAALRYELTHGDVWTVLDELWHAVDWLLPGLHFRFCQWAHLRHDPDWQVWRRRQGDA